MAETQVSVVISAVDRLTAPIRRMNEALARIAAPVRTINAAVGNLGRTAGVDRLGAKFQALGGHVSTVSGKVTALSGAIAGMAGLGGIGLAAGGVALGKSVITTGAQFEKFETILTTIMGSSQKAKESMAWVADFAAKTPYELAEVTDAFVKLKGYGIDPVDGTLKMLGDTAAAMGKPLEDAVEALADGVTGEMERLKAFGIKSETKGDIVAMTFTDKNDRQRIFKAAKNDAKAMQKAILAIFKAKGFEGAGDKLSQTWDGMVSNLMDSISGFWRAIADAGSFDFMKAKLKSLLDWIGKLQADGTLKAWAKSISDTFVRMATTIEDKLKSVDWGAFFAAVKAKVEEFIQTVQQVVAYLGGWENALLAVVAVMNAGLIGGVLSLAASLVTLATSMGGVIARLAIMAANLAALTFGAVVAALGNFITALRAGYGVVAAFNLILSANPIGVVIMAVAALGAAVYALYENWDTVGPYFKAAWEAIKSAFTVAVGYIMDWLGVVFTPHKLVLNAINDMVKAFTGVDMFAVGAEFIGGLWDGIMSKWAGLQAWVSDAFQSLTGWMPDWAKEQMGLTVAPAAPAAPAPSAVTKVANTPTKSAAVAALPARRAAAPAAATTSPAVTAAANLPAAMVLSVPTTSPAVAAAANPGAPVPGHKPDAPAANAAPAATAPTAKPDMTGRDSVPGVVKQVSAPVSVSITVNGVAELDAFKKEAERVVNEALRQWQSRMASDAGASLHD